MRRVTLNDLARQVGFSEATISRALRDDPKIPLVTRNRIRSAAQRMKYRPNTVMSELAAARWQTAGVASSSVLGYIVLNAPESKIGSPLNQLVRPARDQADVLGYRLEVINRAEFTSPLKLQKALIQRGITDLILGSVFDKPFVSEFDWEKFIAVQLMPGRFRSPLHSVLEDHFSNIVLAWERVMSRGYKRIGVILMDHGIRLLDDMSRLGAVHACQSQLSPDFIPIPPFHVKPENNMENEFVRWVENNKPDAIIGFAGEHFHIFRRVFGRAIPYALLNKGAGMAEFSGISDPNQSLGREAVNLLHFCRRTHQWGIPKQRIEHVIEPAWFEGKTLPAKNRSSLLTSSE